MASATAPGPTTATGAPPEPRSAASAAQQVQLRVWRSPRAGGQEAHFDTFAVDVDPARDYVLDCIERAWAAHDRTLVFRHACHHGSCGTCAVRVDGRERLPCITRLAEVWDGSAPLTIEPLRNFPVIADLAVDVSGLQARMAAVRLPYVRTVEALVRAVATGDLADLDGDVGAAERFEDCIECGACISACPVAAGDADYLGPAILAAADRVAEEPRLDDPDRALDLVSGEHGVWQCRSVWACTAVCPSNVDPAGRIMNARRRIIERDWRRLTGGRG